MEEPTHRNPADPQNIQPGTADCRASAGLY